MVVAAALQAMLAAQDRFARIVKDHVPDTPRLLGWSMLADFDGNGFFDVLNRTSLYANTQGNFSLWPTPLTELQDGLAVFDFDGDGRPDVLHAGSSTSPLANSLGIALNRLPAGFVAGTLPTMPISIAEAHAVADFDGDGDLDLMLFPLTTSQGTVQLANDGFGNFTDVTAARMQPGSPAVVAVVALDADHDGDVDVLTPVNGQQQWLQNLGQGVFAAAAPAPMPAGVWGWIGTLDYDGDGFDDLVASNGAVLVSRPAGFFAVPQVFPAMAGRLVTADGDGDADLDVWVEAGNGGYFENVGGGVYVDRRNGPLERVAGTVALTDVDGDGRIDVLAATTRIEVLLGQPGQAFHDLTQLPPLGVHRDFDGDGILDQFFRSGSLMRVRRGLGAGQYTLLPTWSASLLPVLATADLDGDGDLDVIGSSVNSRLSFQWNDGSAGFTHVAPLFGTHGYLLAPKWLAVGDRDGDGDLDLIVFSDPANGPRRLFHLENDGSGTFSINPNWAVPGTPGPVFRAAAFDADGDGDLDLLTSDGDPVLFRNDGTGAMALVPGAVPALQATVGGSPEKLLVGDVDGDGDLDLVSHYRSYTAAQVVDAAVFRNQGNGQFGPPALLTDVAHWWTVDLLDADGDGDLDLAVGLSAPGQVQTLGLWTNGGAANFARASSGFRGPSPGSLMQIEYEFVDVDQDGDLDLSIPTLGYLASNLTRHLRVAVQPRLGGTFALEFAHPEPPALRTVAVLVSTRRLAQPLQVPGGGVFFVDPAVGVVLFGAGNGPIGFSVALPSNPAFLGLELFAQGAHLQGNAFGFTNAVRELLIL